MLTVDYPGGTAHIDADPTDHIGAHYARGRWYERDLLDDARQRVHGPGLAVDVGAHIGGHSLWFALAMGLDVIALEPNPDTYQRLTRTIDANPGNIRAVQAAAGAHLSTASIAVTRRGNTGATRLAIGDGPIQVITLDSLNLTDVRLLKVDVEGMATQVLEGAKRLIDEQSPVIYAEGNPDQIAAVLPSGYRCAGQLCNTPTFVFTREERPPLRLSAAIMAHPTRKEQVEELQAMLDRDVPVAWDPNPEPSPDPQRRWATGRAAWELHDPTADWHLVIQDDATVCADILAGLEAALTELGPEGVVSAYTGTGRPDQRNVRRAITAAEKHGHTWLHTWSLNWGVAIAAPVHTIPGMLDWCSHPNRARTNYDMRIGQYYRDIIGWRTWYTHPSLADHRDTASLIGHGQGGNRKAHTHHAGSALDIDWTRHPGLALDVPTGHRRRH